MTDETLLTIVKELTPILTAIGAIGAMVVSLLNSQKQNRIEKSVTEVHAISNSNLSNEKNRADVADARADGLQKLVQLLLDAKVVADRVKEAEIKSIQPGPPAQPLVNENQVPIKVEVSNEPENPVIVKDAEK